MRPHPPSAPPRWFAARQIARDAVRESTGITAVELARAVGRTLARDHAALVNLPTFSTSAMDGWVVAGQGPWVVVREILAGQPLGTPLEPGTAAVIATGAVIPDGATGVIRREHAEVTRLGGALRLEDVPLAEGQDIRPFGEECLVGDVLGTRGRVVTPALIGLLAAAGYDTLEAFRRPRAAILIFGDELLESGLPASGRIRDALGPQLPGWLDRLGFELALERRVRDTAAAHSGAIADALASCEVIFTTGGTAAGPVDHLHGAIAANGGHLAVDSVACRPGHPMALATFDDSPASTKPPSQREGSPPDARRYLVGLPGNPQSAIIGLLTLGLPLSEALMGRAAPELGSVETTRDLKAPETEDRLIPGCSVAGRFTPAQHLGSAMLRGVASADGFVIVPPRGVPAGADLPWLPLP